MDSRTAKTGSIVTARVWRAQVQAALAEVEGYHAVAGSLQSKQLLGEARGNLSKMNHISHVRCAVQASRPGCVQM